MLGSQTQNKTYICQMLVSYNCTMKKKKKKIGEIYAKWKHQHLL